MLESLFNNVAGLYRTRPVTAFASLIKELFINCSLTSYLLFLIKNIMWDSF